MTPTKTAEDDDTFLNNRNAKPQYGSRIGSTCGTQGNVVREITNTQFSLCHTLFSHATRKRVVESQRRRRWRSACKHVENANGTKLTAKHANNTSNSQSLYRIVFVCVCVSLTACGSYVVRRGTKCVWAFCGWLAGWVSSYEVKPPKANQRRRRWLLLLRYGVVDIGDLYHV